MNEQNDVFKKLREINVIGHVEQKNGLNYLSWAWAWDEVMNAYPEASYEIERFDNKPYLYDEKTGYMVFTKMKINNVEREMWLPVMDGANKAMLDHTYTYKVVKWEYNKSTNKREKVGEETKQVEVATMFDINKTIMRCLVKNLAMFGLGLSLYSGEDLPEEELTEEIANKFVFEKGKHTGKTIKELYVEDKGYLQWWLDSGKDEKLKKLIMLVTDLKPTPIPSEEEQVEKLTLMNRMNELVQKTNTDYKKMLEHYKVKTNSEMTIEQLKDAINVLEKKQ